MASAARSRRRAATRTAALASLALGLMLPAAAPTAAPAAAAGQHSLRFRGSGVEAPDADRAAVPLDPHVPADVGAGSFTLEWWLRTPSRKGANGTARVECGWGSVSWIYGNIVLDRDRYNEARKYGVSLAGGRVVFGVSGDPAAGGPTDRTVCGSTDLRDGRWHHVAVQRRRGDGRMWLFVDGRRQRVADGPDGDISYPDGAPPGEYCGGPCLNDPFLVIGAEKHDAGTAYPSFDGWIDELRISTGLRYRADFGPRRRPFTRDARTLALYHMDAGTGTRLRDSATAPGGPSHGEVRFGGDPVGPVWSERSPFR